MREVMIRRMLVLALCTSGVVALWVVADRSASIPQTADRTLPAPRRTGQVAVPASYAATATPTAHAARSGPYDPTAIRTVRAVPASGGSPRTGHRPRRDDRPPAAVTAVQVLANSHESVTVSWAPVRDRSGIAYYQATLNGIPAGETAGRQLTVDWFNDDMSAHFIQVRAVDGAGNRGPRSGPLMITRPAEPGPSPTAGASTTAPLDRPDPSTAPPTTAAPEAPTATAEPSGSASDRSTAPEGSDPSAGGPRAPGQVMQPPPPPSATAGTLERRNSGGVATGR